MDAQDVLIARSWSAEKGIPLVKVKAALIASGKLRRGEDEVSQGVKARSSLGHVLRCG